MTPARGRGQPIPHPMGMEAIEMEGTRVVDYHLSLSPFLLICKICKYWFIMYVPTSNKCHLCMIAGWETYSKFCEKKTQ